MDPIFFGLKRAFHSTLRVSRRDFQEIALTPARMDILHALFRAHRRDRPMWQSTLRRILGYTARSTLTQMLKAIEALTWIRRKRSPHDARQLEIELTEAGREQIKKAYLRFFPGWSLDAPRWAKGWPTPSADECTAWEAYVDKIGRLDKILSNVRFALRDTGSLRHRWNYD
jgi:DNA-binding MarR family transcriptional regulator